MFFENLTKEELEEFYNGNLQSIEDSKYIIKKLNRPINDYHYDWHPETFLKMADKELKQSCLKDLMEIDITNEDYKCNYAYIMGYLQGLNKIKNKINSYSNQESSTFEKKLNCFLLDLKYENTNLLEDLKSSSNIITSDFTNEKILKNSDMQKVELIGNLTKDIELTKIKAKDGKEWSKGTLSIAVNEGKKEPLYVNFEAWGKIVENASKYLKKGSKVYIEGQLENNNYTDEENKNHYGYKFKVNNIKYLSNKKIVSNEMVDLIDSSIKKQKNCSINSKVNVPVNEK